MDLVTFFSLFSLAAGSESDLTAFFDILRFLEGGSGVVRVVVVVWIEVLEDLRVNLTATAGDFSDDDEEERGFEGFCITLSISTLEVSPYLLSATGVAEVEVELVTFLKKVFLFGFAVVVVTSVCVVLSVDVDDLSLVLVTSEEEEETESDAKVGDEEADPFPSETPGGGTNLYSFTS